MAPVDDRPDPAEVARRVRAAQAYAKLTRDELGHAIGKSGSVIDEITGKRARLRGASWEELRAIADRCGLPFEWFWADFGRLGEIAPATERRRSSTRAGQRRSTRSRRRGPPQPVFAERAREVRSDSEQDAAHRRVERQRRRLTLQHRHDRDERDRLGMGQSASLHRRSPRPVAARERPVAHRRRATRVRVRRETPWSRADLSPSPAFAE